MLGIRVRWRQRDSLAVQGLTGRAADMELASTRPGGVTREQYANLAQLDGQTECAGQNQQLRRSRALARPPAASSLRRSRSERPPQIPKRSSWPRAYSRHSARTSQPLADPLGLPGRAALLGKNASGSVCAHSARSCQLRCSPASSALMPSASCTSEMMTSSPLAHLPVVSSPCARPVRFGAENYMSEITRAACCSSREIRDRGHPDAPG